jgi:DNA polymerase-3 subunit beta
MKIKCTKSELLHGVNTVSKAVPTRTTMPILECILLDATNILTLTGNDMELGIESKVNAEIMEQGSIALDAKIFLEIVRKLPDNFVTIETDDNNQTTIICEKSKFNISGKSGLEFAKLPHIEKNKSIAISSFNLKEIIRQTIFSISDNENNKLMTGELFEISEDNFKVVSLDGHRISMRNIKLDKSYEDIKVVVPGKTLIEISKILSGEVDDIVNIYFSDKHILFELDKAIVISRLIEGEYFKISQMISNDYETKITLNKKDMYNCIDRASLLIKEGDKKPLILTIDDTGMKFKVETSMGSSNEELDVKKDGKNIIIGFNPKFLIEALRVIEDEEISIYMVNPKAPCYIRAAEEKYIYLILPVNIVSLN